MFKVIRKQTGEETTVFSVQNSFQTLSPEFLIWGEENGFHWEPGELFTLSSKEKPENRTAQNAPVVSGKWKIGDTLTLSVGEFGEVDFVCTDEDDEAYRFDSRDCLGEYVPAKGPKMEDFLNRVFAALPAEIADNILTTERKHKNSAGKLYTEKGKLFLPSAAELFPESDCYGDNDLYQQMEYYKDFRNRIKAKKKGDSYPDWYWTSSARSGYSTHWCCTLSNGLANYNGASLSNIAAPVCFRYRKS